MRLARLAAAPAVIASALLCAFAARGEPPARTSSLGWARLAGAEACVPPRALALLVERRLGRAALVAPARADVAIEGRIERAGDGWRATITLTDGSGAALGRRELASAAADCRALDDELALVIALLIDPAAALAPRPPPDVAAPPPPLPAALPPPPPPAPAAPPWRFGATAGVAAGFGLLPHVGGGFTARAYVVPPRWPAITLGGAVWLDNTTTAGSTGATFSLAYGAFAVCPGLTAAGVALEACLGLHVGALRVGGIGFPLMYQAQQLVLDASLEARARRRIVGPLVIAGGAALVVPARRDRFYYRDAQGVDRDVFQMAPVGGVIDLGLGLELP